MFDKIYFLEKKLQLIIENHHIQSFYLFLVEWARQPFSFLMFIVRWYANTITRNVKKRDFHRLADRRW